MKISNESVIQTAGERSLGLQATSIGGGGTGGGADEFAVALPVVTPSGKPLPSIVITDAVDRAGGDGGSGLSAQIDHLKADVETLGAGATGILAQSIGGGGGNGGNALAYGLAIAAPGATAFDLTHTVGGSGGGGGAGDLARVNNTGNVRTHGAGAVSIQVQSIGGGGGNSDSATSSADAMSLYRTIAVNQTIGGSNVSGGGKGGSVDLRHSGRVETRGTSSTGILLQSIGGGGGTAAGGSATASGTFSAKLTVGGQGGAAYASGTNKINLSATLGGSGGQGNSGGDVWVENFGIVRTTGDASYGLFSQSIGGGGGVGVGAFSSDNENVTVNFTVGGSGGGGTAGGQVTVRNTGTISTSGNEAHAIVAHSIGGAGGQAATAGLSK